MMAAKFIGSKISLISKSEIRYEGVLYSLDVKETTISLAKVRSFGTEDRPTDKPAPPKSDVFEFIIFRGAEIKSIDVIETPKDTGIPNDPAILQVSQTAPQNTNETRPRVNNPPRGRRIDMDVSGAIPFFGYRRNNNNGGRDERWTGSRGLDFNYRRGGYNNQSHYNHYSHYNNSPRGSWSRGPMSYRRPPPQGIPRVNTGYKVTFETDFDFEKSHEELLSKLKDAEIKHGETVEKKDEDAVNGDESKPIPTEKTYYKKDDFFDAISCEGLEGPLSTGNEENERGGWHKEFKLNAETFGLAGQRRGRGAFYRGGRRHTYNRPPAHDGPSQGRFN